MSLVASDRISSSKLVKPKPLANFLDQVWLICVVVGIMLELHVFYGSVPRLPAVLRVFLQCSTQ